MNDIFDNTIINFKNFSPYNYFDNMYDNSKDTQTIERIINKLKKYDIFDFIDRIPALNLVPKNQNKCILFDALIESILCSDISMHNSNNIMSSGKFKNIITRLNIWI